MSNNKILIREIQPQDNTQIEQVIRAAFPEFSIPLKGTAYEDIETTQMYESYQGEREVYYVLVEGDQVLGGAGIKALNDVDQNICELQKMYFLPQVRGKGLGKELFQKCLEQAKNFGYQKCYLESASQLKAAVHIYESFGFKHLDGPLGGTGHYSCGVWMIKEL